MSVVELDLGPGEPEPPPDAVFYVDLGHPASYLVAERVLQVMPVATEWVPVALGGIRADPAFAWEPIEAAALERGLQAVRRPPLPFDATLAHRAATFAKSTGRAVAFVLAALRQAYAGGRDLSVEDHVLIAGSACELHPRSLLKAVELRSTRTALDDATQLARERGVRHGPAIWTPHAVFHGDPAPEQAAAAIAEEKAPDPFHTP